jgi:hypothetical protein
MSAPLAAARLKVTNFHPRPPHQGQSSPLFVAAHVMFLIMTTVTLRPRSVTAPSSARLSHGCLIMVP